jgi:hypothetical protein
VIILQKIKILQLKILLLFYFVYLVVFFLHLFLLNMDFIFYKIFHFHHLNYYDYSDEVSSIELDEEVLKNHCLVK